MILFRGVGGFILMYECGCGAFNNDQKYKPGESHFVLKSRRRRERRRERERGGERARERERERQREREILCLEKY
jgi:hypothetical protein